MMRPATDGVSLLIKILKVEFLRRLKSRTTVGLNS